MPQTSSATTVPGRLLPCAPCDGELPGDAHFHDALQGIAADVGVRCSPIARTKKGFTVFVERDEALGHQSFAWVTWSDDSRAPEVQAYASLYSHEKLEECAPRRFRSVEEAVRQLPSRMDAMLESRGLPLHHVDGRRSCSEPRLDASGCWHVGDQMVGRRFGSTVYARFERPGVWMVHSNRWDRSRPRLLGEIHLTEGHYTAVLTGGGSLEEQPNIQAAVLALEAAFAAAIGQPGAMVRFLAATL